MSNKIFHGTVFCFAASLYATSLALAGNGDAAFVFDGTGNPIALEQDRISITRTAATVDSIPASYSIGIEVLEKVDGQPVLDWLVRAGDPLPKKGQKICRAAQSLKAGSNGSVNLKLWEGRRVHITGRQRWVNGSQRPDVDLTKINPSM